jgi:alkylation response protein AidB-like acyl-CoA dehydrogenase
MQITKEHILIQEVARKFARETILPLAKKYNKEKIFPKDIIKKAGELGLMGMLVSEKYGGSNFDMTSYCLVLEEIAYACPSTAIIISVNNMVAWAIETFGDEEQKSKYLPLLCSGDNVAAFSSTEPDAGSDMASINTKAQKDGDYYILNGIKIFVTSGSNAKLIFVTAKTDDKISSFLVEKDTPGLTIGKYEDKMGLCASDTVELIFENCRINKKQRLGEEGNFKIPLYALNHGRVGVASQCVGIAQACFDEAINFAKQRKQFGKYLFEFEGIQWMIAEMATKIEASRALTLHAASLKDQGKEFIKEASMAKLFASQVANEVAYTALQIHGGYGYTKEYRIEQLYRDARVTSIYEGTSEIQKLIIAKQIFK